MDKTEHIIESAEAARTQDALAGAGEVTAPVNAYEDLEIPGFLLRGLSNEQHEEQWRIYCTEHHIVHVHVEALVHARARDEESLNFPSRFTVEAEAHRDLRAEAKREKDRVRITKMKVGIEKKRAVASGATKEMPLSGKDALAKIRGE